LVNGGCQIPQRAGRCGSPRKAVPCCLSNPNRSSVRFASGWDLCSQSPSAGAFLMQGIVGVVLVPALKAHKRLAQAACLNVSVAEIPRALGAFLPSFMRTSSGRAFHDSHPLFTVKIQFIEEFLFIPEIVVRRPTSAGTARPPWPRRGYGFHGTLQPWRAPLGSWRSFATPSSSLGASPGRS